MCLHNIKNEIVNQFQQRTLKNRPYLIGIGGLSGAGKTSLVNQLESELKHLCKIVVIHIDDLIVKRNNRYNTGYEEWYEYYYLQWDVELLTEVLFKGISNHTELTLPFYEKSIDKMIHKTISLTPDSIILMEGVFLQRKEWKGFYDCTIFIDCPREIRYERVRKRDKYIGDTHEILDKYKRRYWLGEDHYLKMENPIESANKVYKIQP